jgi:hypothetical protein
MITFRSHSRAPLMTVLLYGVLATGCYYYRAQAPGAAGVGVTEYQGEVVWSLFWGLVQENPQITNCQGQGLSEVRNTTNFGFALLTVATLGIASPQRVEWKCAPATPSAGGLRDTREGGLRDTTEER